MARSASSDERECADARLGHPSLLGPLAWRAEQCGGRFGTRVCMQSNHYILEHRHLPEEPQVLESPTHAERGAAVRPYSAKFEAR